MDNAAAPTALSAARPQAPSNYATRGTAAMRRQTSGRCFTGKIRRVSRDRFNWFEAKAGHHFRSDLL